MNIESKVWDTTKTGTKIHAFGEDGTALCRSSIQHNAGSSMVTKSAATKWAGNVRAVTICETCEGRFQASIDAEAVEQKTVTPGAVDAMRADTTRPEGSKYSTPEYRALMAEVTRESDAAKGIVREYVIAETEPVKRALVKPEVAPEVIAAVHALRGFSRGETGWAVRDAIKTLDNAGIFAAIDAVTGYDVAPAPEPDSCTCPQGGFTRPRGTHRPECPEAPVSKCTCPAAMAHHLPGCPGDPATVNECTCPIKGGSCVVDGRVMEQVVHMDGCPQAPSVVPGWGRDVASRIRARSAARGDDGAAVRMRNARAEGGFGLGTGQVTEAPETVQCGHCFGDYKPKQDGTLRRHGCWRYDLELETIVYGELDVHGRNNL